MPGKKSKGRRAYRVAKPKVPVLKETMVKAISKIAKKAVLPKAESKMVAFYQSHNDGSIATANRDGVNSTRGWAVQNQKIVNSPTDILKLIPNVFQGSTDNQRIGQKISPVSLVTKGQVRITLPRRAQYQNTDIKVVIYVLQAVAQKNYDSVYSVGTTLLGDLLNVGENDTQPFVGEAFDADRPVSSQYFKLLKKKTIRLRYAGLIQIGGGQPQGSPIASIANAHNYYAEYTLNLTKYLPKSLVYPESADSWNQAEPMNSSIFMCMGFVNQNESSLPPEGQPTALPWIEQCYVSHMKFKDM